MILLEIILNHILDLLSGGVLVKTTGNKGPKYQHGDMKEMIIMTAFAFGLGPVICSAQQAVSRDTSGKGLKVPEGKVLPAFA